MKLAGASSVLQERRTLLRASAVARADDREVGVAMVVLASLKRAALASVQGQRRAGVARAAGVALCLSGSVRFRRYSCFSASALHFLLVDSRGKVRRSNWSKSRRRI